MAKAKKKSSKKSVGKKTAANAVPFDVGQRVKVISGDHGNGPGVVEACTMATAHVRLDSQVHVDPVPFKVGNLQAL